MNRRRRLALWLAAAMAGAGTVVVAATPASAHGAMMQPGSRTYLCWKDGLNPTTGAIEPKNPACAAAVAQNGPNALYNWFAVLRSDGGGRMAGYIPDGKLCSAAATVYDFSGFDLARNDWPVTHLTSGATMEFDYNNWANHPGTFSLYVTKDGFDPTKPMAWSDLESTPFLQVTNPPAIGGPGTADGHYYWTGTLPSNKSGRHIIYSVWARSDSQETFYGCSDVVFDGGHGEVTGLGTSSGPTGGPSTPAPPTGSATATATATRSATASPTGPGSGGGRCTASYTVTSSWQGAFQVDVKVSNPGTSAISGWTTGWNYTGGQTISQSWNATVNQSGTAVTAQNVSYNGIVPAGGSTDFGFIANGTPGSAPSLTCTAAGGSGGPPPTSSQPASPSVLPTSSGPTSQPPPTGCTTAAFCDGFESQTGSSVSGAWTTSYRDCQGTGTATVDTTVAHSGSKSVRIDGKAGYCNHVMVKPTQDLSGLGSVWYGRFYVRHSTALPVAHVAFAALKDNADSGKDLRMGGQNSALQWNRESDDATLPAQSPAGIAQSKPLPTGQWNCVEFMIDGRGLLSTWLNGTAVPGLTVDGTPTADIDQQWLSRTWRPQVTDLRLGWENYSTGDDTLWFDDVAVGASRIGC